MASRFEHIKDADWHFLDDSQYETVLAGARDAYHAVNFPRIEGVEDFEQDALIYVATHKQEIQKIRTLGLLRRTIRQRLIKFGKTQWRDDELTESFEELEADW